MLQILLGITIGVILHSIVEELVLFFLSLFELAKSYFSIIIAKNKTKAQQYFISDTKRAIGFSIAEEDIEENDI